MPSQRNRPLAIVLTLGAGLALSALPLAGPAQQAQAQAQPLARVSSKPVRQIAGRTIYVSPAGHDDRSRITAASRPVATIARAIRLAQPGDTIVVGGGTYLGAAGYGARPGRSNAPIRLQNAPGERVLIKGTLQLEDADYWWVSGINVTQDPTGPRKEFLVKFDGGTGWRFTHAEVWGTKGVSNLMISGSPADGRPADYLVSDDCIHDNDAVGDAFMNDHNIYLMPGYTSGPGMIEHNLLFNAKNGAGIKAAGPSSSTGAARVTIQRNTITRSAAGVIVGYGSNRVELRNNLIGGQLIRPPAGARYVANYHAAVIGNHVDGVANKAVSTAVWGFRHALWSTGDSPHPVHGALTSWLAPVFDSTTSCAGFHPRNPAAQPFGRFS